MQDTDVAQKDLFHCVNAKCLLLYTRFFKNY